MIEYPLVVPQSLYDTLKARGDDLAGIIPSKPIPILKPAPWAQLTAQRNCGKNTT